MPDTDEAFAESLVVTAVDADEEKADETLDLSAGEPVVLKEPDDEAQEKDHEEAEDTEGDDGEDQIEDEPATPAITDDTVIRHRWDKNGPEEDITIAELRDGALRWSDYTQKTTAIKAAEAIRVQEHMDALAGLAVQSEQEPDWGAYAQQGYSAVDIFQAQTQWRQKVAQSDEAKVLYHQLQTTQQAEKDADIEALKKREIAAIYKIMPDIADAEKRPAIMAKVQSAAKHIGLSSEDVQGITDHRMIHGLSLIAQHLESQAAKPAIAKKVADATSKALPRTARRNRTDKKAQQQQARQKLKDTGSDESFMAVLQGG